MIRNESDSGLFAAAAAQAPVRREDRRADEAGHRTEGGRGAAGPSPAEWRDLVRVLHSRGGRFAPRLFVIDVAQGCSVCRIARALDQIDEGRPPGATALRFS